MLLLSSLAAGLATPFSAKISSRYAPNCARVRYFVSDVYHVWEPSSILNETGAVKFFGHWPSLIFVAMMLLSFCGQVKRRCRRDLQA